MSLDIRVNGVKMLLLDKAHTPKSSSRGYEKLNIDTRVEKTNAAGVYIDLHKIPTESVGK